MKKIGYFLVLIFYTISCSASELFYFDPREPLKHCPIESNRALQWFKFVSESCDDGFILLECAVHVHKIQETEKKRSTTPPSVHWLDEEDRQNGLLKFLSAEQLGDLRQTRKNNKKIQEAVDKVFPL